MAIEFIPKTWKDRREGGTPIIAAELNRIEQGIAQLTEMLNKVKDYAYSAPIANLLTTEKGFPLDASMGRVLDSKNTELTNQINALNGSLAPIQARLNGSANITIIQSNNYTIGKEYTAQSALNDAVFNIAMLNWELCPLVLPRWYNETWSSMDLYTMSPVGDAIAMVISVARLLYKTATPTVFKIEKVTKCTCYNGSVPVIEHLTSGEVQLQLEMLPNLYHS